MTSEERIAAIERIVKSQLNMSVIESSGEIGQVIATKDELFSNCIQYVFHAQVVTGDTSLQYITLLMSVHEYWEFVKKLADPKALVVTDDDVRIAECYDRSKHYIG